MAWRTWSIGQSSLGLRWDTFRARASPALNKRRATAKKNCAVRQVFWPKSGPGPLRDDIRLIVGGGQVREVGRRLDDFSAFQPPEESPVRLNDLCTNRRRQAALCHRPQPIFIRGVFNLVDATTFPKVQLAAVPCIAFILFDGVRREDSSNSRPFYSRRGLSAVLNPSGG